MGIAGVLLGGGASRRFGSPKLEARLGGTRLVDVACGHFLEAGMNPVVFCGRVRPGDARVLVVEPGREMIETLRNGLRAIPEGPFAFAPADMPALGVDLLRRLMRAFEESGESYLIPVHAGRRGHPAFAREREPFFRLGDEGGPREIWRAAGDDLVRHLEVETADVLFDVDEPDDLAAAGDEAARCKRLLARGDLRC
jgi:molybdenum cofactor cytidylyltransferase